MLEWEVPQFFPQVLQKWPQKFYVKFFVFKLATKVHQIFCYSNIFAAGMIGSPMFTKELNHQSFIQVFPYSKLSSPSLKQMTIMGWMRPDAIDEGNVLVSKMCRKQFMSLYGMYFS